MTKLCLKITGMNELIITACFFICLLTWNCQGYYVSGSYGNIGLAFFIPNVNNDVCNQACELDNECPSGLCQSCRETCQLDSNFTCCPTDSIGLLDVCLADSDCCSQNCFSALGGITLLCCLPNNQSVNILCVNLLCCSGFLNLLSGTCECIPIGSPCLLLNDYPQQCCNNGFCDSETLTCTN